MKLLLRKDKSSARIFLAGPLGSWYLFFINDGHPLLGLLTQHAYYCGFIKR